MTVLPGDWITPVTIELAFGADLTANSSTWTWTDVSDWLLDQQIQITRGRSDESQQVQPTSVSFTLDNLDGRFTPGNPLSPHYPHVQRRTPCRISIEWNSTQHRRFTGFVYEWSVDWPHGGATGESRVAVTASGSQRRLNRLTSEDEDPFTRSIAGVDRVDAYWPLTERHGRNSPLDNVDALDISDNVEFGDSDAAPEGLQPVMRVPGFASFEFDTGHFTFADNEWSVEFLCRLDGAPSSPLELMEIRTESDDATLIWRLIAEPTQFTVEVDGDVERTDSYSVGSLYDDWFVMMLMVHDDGTDVSTLWAWSSLPDVDQTQELRTFSSPGNPVGLIRVQSDFISPIVDLGHIVITDGSGTTGSPPVTNGIMVFSDTTIGSTVGSHALAGRSAEEVLDRMERIAGESDTPLTVDDSLTVDSAAMGLQQPASVFDTWRDCENVDGGILIERRDDVGMLYIPRRLLDRRFQTGSSIPPTLNLDAAADEISIPFTPVLDDQRSLNDMTVTTPTDASGRVIDSASIDETERYADDAELNLAAGDDTLSAAGWLLHIRGGGTTRYPRLTMDLTVMAQVIDDWLDTDVGDGIHITNLPDQHPDDVDLLVQGYRETFSPTVWRVQCNCSPGSLWRVAAEGWNRFDTDGSELNTSIDETETAIGVATTVGNQWTEDTGHFPFDVRVGGERMTVTNIAPFGSVQVFEVTRSVNGIVKSHPSGSPVALANPAYLGW